MDYAFTTAPADFQVSLVGSDVPLQLHGAVSSVWAVTAQTDPSYEVCVATGDLWTVVRIAAVRQEV